MVTAAPLDGDHEVAQVVIVTGPADLIDGRVEGVAVVRERRGRHQDGAVEIGEHLLGAGCGAIDRDDAKVFGADLLHARMKSAAGLLNNVGTPRTGAMTGARTGYRDCFRTGLRATPILSTAVRILVLLFRKPTYQCCFQNGQDGLFECRSLP